MPHEMRRGEVVPLGYGLFDMAGMKCCQYKLSAFVNVSLSHWNAPERASVSLKTSSRAISVKMSAKSSW